jgi:hypothetical protein
VITLERRPGVLSRHVSRIRSIQASGDEWAILNFVTSEAVKTIIVFGAITVLVVRWHRWWLTGPAVLFAAITEVPALLQDLVIIVGAVATIVTQSRQALPRIMSTIVRLAHDALMLVYLALMVTALVM